MTAALVAVPRFFYVSTHMPLARHDEASSQLNSREFVSTHMPLARHDILTKSLVKCL